MSFLLAACYLFLVGVSGEIDLGKLEDRPLTATEKKHLRSQSAFSIGEGFEGSPSDWTEYIVWLVGVIGVFSYWMHPNMHRLRESDEQHADGQDVDGQDVGEQDVDGQDADEHDKDS